MNNHNGIGQSSGYLYTHQLPYAIRKDICDILDADKSWRTLGGYFLGLDGTQLALIGQAVLRNGSPTEELLNKLDSANFSISDFCFFLKQMNHYRALEILKPYVAMNGYKEEIVGARKSDSICPITNNMDQKSSKDETLNTPTHSFADQPAAIMGFDQSLKLFSNLESDPWALNCNQHETILKDNLTNQVKQETAPSNCHNSRGLSQAVTRDIENRVVPSAHPEDPGEEIVRMACANNRKRTSISDQEVVNQLRLIMQINYKELKQASNDFSDSNIIGNGGFASVYRGNWKGTDVAIKRLKCNLMDQALNELTILNSYRIDNILPIYGISIDGPEACLVYQFMSNGSLEARLHQTKPNQPQLTWKQRVQIGEGTAKGLYYLHNLKEKPLVHADVKPQNILLSDTLEPKLGDFGLARQMFVGENPINTHCTVSSVHGTGVYLAPEYLRNRRISPAVDVYSYGIVLLEMATGRRAYDGKRLLVDIVEEETRVSAGKISHNLKDPRLTDETEEDLKMWYELVKLGMDCSHKVKKKRLNMELVLQRFAEFRTDNSVVGNNISSRFPESTHNEAAVNKHLLQQQSQLPKVSDLIQSFNSVMSIEEEPELRCNVLDQAAREQKLNNLDNQPVEAMIPLLTELGVVTELR